VPAEYSSGERTRRGSITKAGSAPVRTALIETAWSYRFRPALGVTLRRRQHGAARTPWLVAGRRSAACTPAKRR
jgi:transposase